MFAEFGVPVEWSEDEYADLLRIGGGKERMALDPHSGLRRAGRACRRSDAEQADLVASWHRRKTDIYTEHGARPAPCHRVPAYAGSSEEAAAAGWQLAVASTSAEPPCGRS